MEAPQVIPPTYTPASVLQQHNKTLKNERFQNRPDHIYTLRSQSCPRDFSVQQLTTLGLISII